MDITINKICRDCKDTKDKNLFPSDRAICKACLSVRKKIYYDSKIKSKHLKPVGRPKKVTN